MNERELDRLIDKAVDLVKPHLRGDDEIDDVRWGADRFAFTVMRGFNQGFSTAVATLYFQYDEDEEIWGTADEQLEYCVSQFLLNY